MYMSHNYGDLQQHAPACEVKRRIILTASVLVAIMEIKHFQSPWFSNTAVAMMGTLLSKISFTLNLTYIKPSSVTL